MRLRDRIDKLFKPWKQPEHFGRQAQEDRKASIAHLREDFVRVIVQAAADIPDEKAAEREKFVEYAWRAYVIAMYTHDAHFFPAGKLSPLLNKSALRKLYAEAVRAVSDDDTNDEFCDTCS